LESDDFKAVYPLLGDVIRIQSELEEEAPPEVTKAVTSMNKFLKQNLRKLSEVDLKGIKQCAAPNCDNWFIPGSRGNEQKYCSNACRQRAFQAKQKNH
jgi:predicted RNA-binding Zn ribbon-like protein